ncbi:hypothetical protein HWC35_gp026 [Vibrio phage USC-1]|uniref:Uncharacterized protein n=2 Tax=Aphroditevirus USC1 TaxID=2846605 RepID=A0A514A2A9_9CAUD|nr:hypothetical protein HWC35_gp026 [Vibrio phage USC-1]QCW23096.1 hypothetical protein [Vibrio phage 5 TSL-2019]QDH47420.1 hypothetical protein [Vibrio phage USC-1]
MIDMTESKEILKKIKEASQKTYKDMSPLEVSEFNTKILQHPLVTGTVRSNLMTIPNYSPYCGGFSECDQMPRTDYKRGQFQCPVCGWRSSFPEEFMSMYRYHWGLD